MSLLLRPPHSPLLDAPRAAPPLVVIAASAGGIPAVQEILKSIPSSFPAAIALVLHRRALRADLLPMVLQRRSRMVVKGVEPGEHLRAGVLYVAPADKHLVVSADGSLATQDGRRIRHLLSSADPLFRSAAEVLGSRVVAVVLTGSGANGASGVRIVKDHGGIVIAQDRESSQHFAMPAAAIATGAVDRVLPLEQIGPALVSMFPPEPGR